MTYASEVWDGIKCERDALDVVLRVALRVMMGLAKSAPTELLHWETGVPLISTRMDAAKLRWDEKLKKSDATSLAVQASHFTQVGRARRGRPATGRAWGNTVAAIRAELAGLGVMEPFQAVQKPAAGAEQGGEEGEGVCQGSNQALNANLWLRDVRKTFIRGRQQRWLESARPLWYPLCMSTEGAGLQEHLRHLSFEDGRLVSLARVGVVNVDQTIFKPRDTSNRAFVGSTAQGGSNCCHCHASLCNARLEAAHLFGASCPELLVPRATFLRDISTLVPPALLAYFRDIQNMGTKWARAMFCPVNACALLEVEGLKTEALGGYWAAVAKFVRFAVDRGAVEEEYESDDEVDFRFLSLASVGGPEEV